MKKQLLYQEVLICVQAISLMMLLGATHLSGQDSIEKDRARLSLEHFTSNTNGHQLKATVKAKLDASYVRIPGVKLNFYRNEISADNYVSSATTNQDGEAIVSVPVSRDIEHPSGLQVYWVSLDNNMKFLDNTQDLQVKPALLEVDAIEEDSLRFLSISLTTIDSSNSSQPIAGEQVNIYVKRMFGLLPISEDFEATDEAGQLDYEFPQDIPGDMDGKIDMVIKVEEHEMYGTLLYETTLDWGIPLQIDQKTQIRELWSSRSSAPIYLIVVTNTLILIIWTVIVDVVRRIFLIRKLGREKSEEDE